MVLEVLMVPKAGLKSSFNTMKNNKKIQTILRSAPFCAPTIYFDVFKLNYLVYLGKDNKSSIRFGSVARIQTRTEKNFFLEKLFTLFTKVFYFSYSITYAVNGW